MKHIAKIAAFTAIFLIINLIFCGFMPPDNGSSLDMWRSYHQKQSIDIAVIGSSLASCALPEEELAAATGETVALMATNAQSLDMSQIALETLLREHSPRYVILVMDLTNMTGKPYAKAQKAFLYAELQTDSWKDKPADLLRYMTSRDNFTGADSLNALFPLAERQLAHRLARYDPTEVECRAESSAAPARCGPCPAGGYHGHQL